MRKQPKKSDDPNYGHCDRRYAYLKPGDDKMTILHGCRELQIRRNELLKDKYANPKAIAQIQDILDACPIACVYKSTELGV